MQGTDFHVICFTFHKVLKYSGRIFPVVLELEFCMKNQSCMLFISFWNRESKTQETFLRVWTTEIYSGCGNHQSHMKSTSVYEILISKIEMSEEKSTSYCQAEWQSELMHVLILNCIIFLSYSVQQPISYCVHLMRQFILKMKTMWI